MGTGVMSTLYTPFFGHVNSGASADGSNGSCDPQTGRVLQQIPGTSEGSVQESSALGTAKILRRTLKLPGLWWRTPA